MTYIVLIWSCSLGDPLCTHPDATWSGRTYHESNAWESHEWERRQFLRANPTREVVSFEVMSKARWEAMRGSYHCSQIGGGE